MNSEEEFEEWSERNKITAEDFKRLLHESFRLGHHQGMTRAAEICKEQKNLAYEEGEGTTYIPGWIEQCIKFILTERDKNETNISPPG